MLLVQFWLLSVTATSPMNWLNDRPTDEALCGLRRRDELVVELVPYLHWLIIEGMGGAFQDKSPASYSSSPLRNHIQNPILQL